MTTQDEHDARRKLEALAELTSRLAVSLSEADVAAVVLERGMLAMNADTCMLYRVEADGGLGLVAERGCEPATADALRRIEPTATNASMRAVGTGRSLWVENEAQGALFPEQMSIQACGPRARAFWSAPLIVENVAVGLLTMGFYEPRLFSEDDRAFVETIARNAAQALRRAQHRQTEASTRHALETMLESIGDAVIATDTEGRITLLNPVAQRLTGHSEPSAIGRFARDVFHVVNEHTRMVVETPIESVLHRGGTVAPQHHRLLVAKDGRETPIDDSAAPIRDGSGALLGVVLVFRDVTAKRREERRQAFLADAATVLGASLDYDATLARIAQLAVPEFADWCAVDVLEPNKTLRRVANAHVDPARINVAREVGDRFPPSENAPGGVHNVLRTGVAELYPNITSEMLRNGTDSDEHFRMLSELKIRSAMIVPLLARGQTLGAITCVYAESGRNYTEDDLSFAADLARRAAMAMDNARLYAAEQQARQAADVANRVKDEFLATLSHELRTPLNAITGWARMLTATVSEPEQFARAVTTIERNAASMAHLIDDLLDVSRIVAGKVRLEMEDTDLARVVEATAESSRPIAAAKGITLESSHDGPAPWRGDPKRLEQMVANLISNAVKFSSAGQRIYVRLTRTPAAYEITVADQGRGIDPRFLPHVFDPFMQADGTSTRKHGGLGLGLAITHELVQLHGGDIRVESAGEGRGATFVITLPRGDRVAPPEYDLGQLPHEDSPVPVSARLPRSHHLDGLRVLVVDDEPDARQLLQLVLGGHGCAVQAAASALEALDILDHDPIDVLVSDIGMPDQDGYDLIRRARAMPMPQGGVPAIALTAFTRAEDRRRAIEAGFTMHLGKPIHTEELLSALTSLSRSSHAPPGPSHAAPPVAE